MMNQTPKYKKELTSRRFRQNKVLITGGTEGIGNGIAKWFLAQKNNQVAICARTEEKLNAMNNLYSNIITKKVDLHNKRATGEFAQQVINDLGGLDILILNAADFDFKNKFLSKAEIAIKIPQINNIANIQLIKNTRKELKKSNGVIVFMTTRFMMTGIETAPGLDNQSIAVQEDIGEYIKSKMRMHKYLNKFIKDKQNNGIFVFSIIPGTVNTPANRKLIEVGTPELSNSKIKEKLEGRERDPNLVGKIIGKMTVMKKMFDAKTMQYDINIKNGQIVEISNAAIEFEKKQEQS